MHFNDGSVIRLYRQTVEDFGLYAGRELSADEFDKLKIAAGAMSAKMRAIRIVAATAVSRQDLEHRLVAKGEDPGQAQEAVQWMSDLNLVDDRQVAEQIVHRCIQKGYGLARAKQALYEKRIPKSYWSDALEGYPEQDDAIIRYLQEHLDETSDIKEKKRAIDALIRRGHSYGVIKKAMENLAFNTDDIPEG